MKYRISILTLLFLSSCWELHNTATPQASPTLETSKNNEFFICELKPEKNKLIIDKGDSVEIEQIWIEKVWYYTRTKNKFRKIDSNQIVVTLKRNKQDDFLVKWGMGISKSRYGSSNGNIDIPLGATLQDEYYIKSYKYLEEYAGNSAIAVDSIKVVRKL